MNKPFALHSSRILLPDGLRPAYIIIADGKIVGVANHVNQDDYIVEDVGDSVIMPGVIDPHVHINEPGRTEWEGFDTATKAAIAGGVTTLVDMPLNASPATTTAAAFDEKITATNNKLHTNIGFWGGLVPGNENDIKGLI